MSPLNATCLLVISDRVSCRQNHPIVNTIFLYLLVSLCYKPAHVDRELYMPLWGKLCVREHLIEKEVCHVQIP